MALEIGSRLGHYDVTALIGDGGMGHVGYPRLTLLSTAIVQHEALMTTSYSR